MKARITNIKRFAVHDGDGIRTTVFFKGCSLHCLWCHNPETILPQPQLALYAHKCVGCGICATLCACHIMADGRHEVERQRCTACRRCEEACPQGAWALIGKEVEEEALLPLLLQDSAFYRESGGGVTLSGGECLLQADFCAALLRRLKENGIHTAVDTCGYVPRQAFEKVMPFTDVFLYDVKAIDEGVHIACTGHSNQLILENLRYLDDCGKALEIRVPYVPNYNSGEQDKILSFLSKLHRVTKIRVLPYHRYAASQYEALGLKNTLPTDLPTEDEVRRFQEKADALCTAH